MATRRSRLFRSALTACLTCMAQAGCGQTSSPSVAESPSAPVVAAPAEPARPGTEAPAPPTVVDFNQLFGDAVVTDVLEGHHLPPDLTYGGKKTGPLRAAVEFLWSKVKLTDDVNHPVLRTLRIDTGEGPFEIELRPELAPNHVRNFLVLAKLGFYDGLLFERSVHQRVQDDDTESRIDLLIAGCPTGTGDEGYGHLGYFVRAEIEPDLRHAEGTVGFWHEEDPDSAGTRFYIALGPAPALDGKFTVIGRVVSGMDVLKRIAAAPVKSANPDSPDSEKPAQPVTIKKVAISPDVLEK